MELNGWVSPQMLTRYGASARAARARRTYDRIMNGEPGPWPCLCDPGPERPTRGGGTPRPGYLNWAAVVGDEFDVCGVLRVLSVRELRPEEGVLHEKSKTMTAPKPRPRQSKQLDAGGFQAEISSFRLHLAAEGKACKTVRTYTEAVQWFAAAHLCRETDLTSWEQVAKQDIQRWIVRLLDRYSSAYASNQYRALQQFFKWLAAEEEVSDPMAGLKPPRRS